MENLNNGLVQAARFGGRDAVGTAARIKSCTPKSLGGLHITQAGQARLVEQEELQRAPTRPERCGEARLGELG